MTLETITLAVGPKETKRTEELKRALLDVAVPTDAMVVLLHVFSESAYREGVVEAGYDPENPPEPDTLATRLESIDDISATLHDRGVEHRIRGEIGDVTDEVLGAVEATDTDMLLVGGRRRSPTGKAVFGSTAHRVMMHAPCPVLFVREGFDST